MQLEKEEMKLPLSDAGKDLVQEEKGVTEDKMVR